MDTSFLREAPLCIPPRSRNIFLRLGDPGHLVLHISSLSDAAPQCSLPAHPAAPALTSTAASPCMEGMKNIHPKWMGCTTLILYGGNAKCSPHMEAMQNAHSKYRGCKLLNQYGGDAKRSLQMEGIQNAQPVWRPCKFLTTYGDDAKCSLQMERMQNAQPIWRQHKTLMPYGDPNAHPNWRRHKMLTPYGGNAKRSTVYGLEVVQNVHPKKEVMHNAPRGTQQHTAGCGCPSCVHGETEIKRAESALLFPALGERGTGIGAAASKP